jgi:hypothetical protein
MFLSKENYHFTTYNYGILDSNDDDDANLVKNIPFGATLGEWTFLY